MYESPVFEDEGWSCSVALEIRPRYGEVPRLDFMLWEPCSPVSSWPAVKDGLAEDLHAFRPTPREGMSAGSGPT